MVGSYGDTAVPGTVPTTYYAVNVPAHPRLASARSENEELATKLAAAQAARAELRSRVGSGGGGSTLLKIVLVAGLGYLIIKGIKSN